MQKEKESLFKKALKILAPSLFAIAVMVASFGCFSMVTNAAESYTYSVTHQCTPSQYNGQCSSLHTVTFTSPYKLVGYVNGNYLAIHVVDPAYVDKSGSWVNRTIPLTNVPHGSSSTFSTVDVRDLEAGGDYISMSVIVSTDIPYFTTRSAAISYATTGDDSGQLNKPEIIEDPGEFSLLGFEVDNSILATWSDINCNFFYDYNDIYVSVKPTYFVMLESGEEYQNFESVGTLEVPYTDFKFEHSYEDYFVNNPYAGRCQLILTFTPIHKPSDENVWDKGQSIVVKFDENGNITDSILPDAAFTPQYDSECKFIYPYSSYNVNNDSFYLGWDSVSASHSSEEIISNWIKVDFVNSLYQDIEYSVDYYWSEKFMVLDYSSIENTLKRTADTTPLEIWLTPFYKTSTGSYYGHSFITQLEGKKVVGEFETSGDPFNDDTSAGDSSMRPVDKDDPVYVGGVTPDDGGGTFDFATVFDNFISLINTFLNSAGQIPSLVNKIFGFLPGAYSSMLIGVLSLVIILRVIGR